MAGRVRQGSVWYLIKGDGDLPPGLREVKDFLDVLEECDEEVVESLVAVAQGCLSDPIVQEPIVERKIGVFSR